MQVTIIFLYETDNNDDEQEEKDNDSEDNVRGEDTDNNEMDTAGF